MKLSEILDLPEGVRDLDVTRVEIDSRRCQPGDVFFAMPGRSDDGRQFINDAVANGASVVVTTDTYAATVPVIVVPASSLHATLVRACQAVTGHPERSVRLLGVTGTNGKTSVTTIFAQMWRALGHDADVIGTLTHERTTPAPPELFRELARVRDLSHGPDTAVALEVSSHALTQGRVDGVVFDVAVFTNLSLDHLDYHHSMEEYFAAKSQLFDSARCQHAVVFTDDPYGQRLSDAIGVPVTRVHRRDATDVVSTSAGTTFRWRGCDVSSPLRGSFNVDNALLAMTSAVVLGASPRDVAEAMSDVARVPGRFDVVRDASPTVVVDYAHTPDGLLRVLRDAREIAGAGRLIVVFGCGGERDASKRPVMGRIAGDEADVVVITSDNPRSEDPEAIISEILAGVDEGVVVHRDADRRGAIEWALRSAALDDVVVIAGKGHEKTQLVGPHVLEFDDRVVVADILGASN